MLSPPMQHRIQLRQMILDVAIVVDRLEDLGISTRSLESNRLVTEHDPETDLAGAHHPTQNPVPTEVHELEKALFAVGSGRVINPTGRAAEQANGIVPAAYKTVHIRGQKVRVVPLACSPCYVTPAQRT